MIKEIVKYPQTPSIEFNAPVRSFNNDLIELIQDLKDTIEANNLKALSAFQIGNPYSVIVVKQDDGTYLELINARILKSSGKITTDEQTTYFGEITASVTRDKDITVMYENRDAKQCFIDANDDFAVLLQRKIDYNFGANFRQKLDATEKEKLDMKLDYGVDAVINNENCPTVFHRDKILKVINILLGTNLLAIFIGLFISNENNIELLSSGLNYSFGTILILIITYFFYAQYEGRKYTNCMSCQIGNIIGTALMHLIKLIVLYSLFYFFI